MTSPLPLEPASLHHACDPERFGFQTTAELEDLGEFIGQIRALDAVRFGTGIRHEGYNLFVLGPPGIGKRSLVNRILQSQAGLEPKPDDWCYLNNFLQPHKPRALRLPPGRGEELRSRMAQLVDYLRTALPALFENEDYRAKVKTIDEEFRKRQEEAFKELGEEAHRQQILLLRTPEGFAFAPTRNQEVIPPEDYEQLAEEERARVRSAISALQEQLEALIRKIPRWHREAHDRLKRLERETTLGAVEHLVSDLRETFATFPEVQEYLGQVQQDMVENVGDFLKQEEPFSLGGRTVLGPEGLRRYQVNALVTNGKKAGAPIISEDNPTHSNLVGRIEHIAHLGALVTDFTLIKPGALHLANGGYLLLDIRKILIQPFAWEALKRALQSHEVRIESLGQMFSLVSTVSLEPEPIPLQTKVILFGDRVFYYLLQEYDPEFGELFKVAADFEDRIERTPETQLLYARMIATLVRKEGLQPLDREAVARVIEHSSRQVGDGERLSAQMRSVADLLREADFWAREAGRDTVQSRDVQQSIDTQIRRQDRLRNRVQEEILRGTLMITTEGTVTGQINGLSVIELGGFAFAQPIRITATARLGEGELVNIEREVKLSGAIHSKGVLILSSFLSARYAGNQPLSLAASLVFEQSYGIVEGDSASLAELCALLSELAGVPISQALAVTGSVNQFGQTQAIGAVNEKIEGFFDICAARGLNGQQGVLIPAANVKHLMLRSDVVAAAAAGQFRLFAVETVDQAMRILTGLAAGEVDFRGAFPEGTVNGRVVSRLAELTRIRDSFSRRSRKDKEKKKARRSEPPAGRKADDP